VTKRARRFHTTNAFFLGGLLLFLFLSACQQAPTKIVEAPQMPWARLTETTAKPLKLTDSTVVVDARSDFDFGLGHWSSAYHLPWEALAGDTKKPSSLLTPEKAIQKLALLGITPKTPVIVIGYGLKGHGEEGRVAWALAYYGIEDVQTVSVNGLDVYFTHEDSPQRRNADPWTPKVRDQMLINRTDFIQAVTSPRQTEAGKVFIVDVRSKEEYFSRKQEEYETPDLRSIQIDWHEFYREDGRPSKKTKKQLTSVGVGVDDEVIVIDSDGLRSSAAAYALTALGFHHVQNFIGGFDSLLKKK
jgi:3-mercaptopyruvate sulfurtransferase SseA